MSSPYLPELLPFFCRDCQYLDLLLEELGYPAVALNSHKSQAQRLLALNRFKSGQVPVLLATDVGSRGLDIQTVDLVINYDMPMCVYTKFICNILKLLVNTFFLNFVILKFLFLLAVGLHAITSTGLDELQELQGEGLL